MQNKFNVDYWIEAWHYKRGKVTWKIHLDYEWQPAVYEDCIVVIVRNGKWRVGVKMYNFTTTYAILHVRLFAEKYLLSEAEIIEHVVYGGWNE